MPSTYDLKQKFSDLLRPIANWCVRKNISANDVTLTALWMSIIFAIFFACFPNKFFFWAFPVVLFLRMALNNIDGVIAREHKQITKRGGVLNELGDIISDACLYGAFAFVPGFSPLTVIIFVLFGIFSEFTGVLAQLHSGKRSYAGPITKSDRALIMSVIAILLALDLNWYAFFNPLITASIVFMGFNMRNRIADACKEKEVVDSV